MKYPIYLRVARKVGRKGYKVAAGTSPDNEPLKSGSTYQTTWYPTVSFCISVDIPDELFVPAERMIAELNIAMKDAVISSEILLPSGISLKGSKKVGQ
jgi:hypothetical protein